MEYVLSAEEMQKLDRVTIDEIGLPGAVLMETAGRAVARAAYRELDARPGGASRGRAAIVCGGGNNGGDGFVVARCLAEWGAGAVAYLAAPREKLRGDAAVHFAALENAGGAVVSIATEEELAENAAAVTGADVVVDAVFGTGLAREVTGHYRRVIETLSACEGVRIAVDIPSGLSADTGEPLGVAAPADITVTIAFQKVGLTAQPGFARAGAVEVAEIGIPRRLAPEHGVALGLLEARDVAGMAPSARSTDHKFQRGHVVAIAGAPGTRGAARLAARGALRSGAGLATIASPWRGAEVSAPDPVMTAELDPDGADAHALLGELFRRAHVAAIGPGMPASEGGQKLVLRALSEAEAPIVLDADGLNHAASDIGTIAASPAPVVLTPHPGEAARLLETTSREVQRDRVAAARRLAEKTRATVLLKGARTLVCDGAGAEPLTTINPTGGSALATAGAGDVLTGAIAALIGQGLKPADAARLGAYLHGRAGDLASASLGPSAVTASDVIEFLPAARRELDEGAGARSG